jgi:calcium-dependent protein kinase
MDHPNVIQIYEFYDEAYHFALVTDISKGGEILDQLTKREKLFESEAIDFVRTLLSTIAYVHENGIVHRDLKPANCILEEDLDFKKMKLIDFGTAGPYDKSGKEQLDELVGTPYYLAPEVIKGKYSEKCDIWSIGVIAIQVLTGDLPYNGRGISHITNKIVNDPPNFSQSEWFTLSDEAMDFCKLLLTKDYEKRPSALEALKHKWLTSTKTENSIDSKVFKSLSNFRATELLKQASFSYLASHAISKKEMGMLSEQFKAIDKSGDGQISKSEIMPIFEKVGIQKSEQEMKEILDHVDIDGSGKITYSEFVAATANKEKLLTD